MKALSMLQPWASLVFMQATPERMAKEVETRSFNTTHRGDLLIHASVGKHYGKLPNRVSCRELCYTRPFDEYVYRAAYDKLPFGAIIGKVSLVYTMQFGSEKAIKYVKEEMKLSDAKREFAFGDWSEGRWGWVFENPILFQEPIPAKGSLGLWDFNFEPHKYLLL